MGQQWKVTEHILMWYGYRCNAGSLTPGITSEVFELEIRNNPIIHMLHCVLVSVFCLLCTANGLYLNPLQKKEVGRFSYSSTLEGC